MSDEGWKVVLAQWWVWVPAGVLVAAALVRQWWGIAAFAAGAAIAYTSFQVGVHQIVQALSTYCNPCVDHAGDPWLGGFAVGLTLIGVSIFRGAWVFGRNAALDPRPTEGVGTRDAQVGDSSPCQGR